MISTWKAILHSLGFHLVVLSILALIVTRSHLLDPPIGAVMVEAISAPSFQKITQTPLPMPEKTAPSSEPTQNESQGGTNQALMAPPSQNRPTTPPAEAKPLDAIQAEYPLLSRRLGEEGRVELRLFLKSDGSVEKVEIEKSSGHKRLDDSALSAMAKAKFETNGAEMKMYSVIFRLKN